MEIENKLAVITGSSYGLGKTIAYHLSDAGAEVILLARSEDKLKMIVEDLKSKGNKAHHYKLDLLSLDALELFLF